MGHNLTNCSFQDCQGDMTQLPVVILGIGKDPTVPAESPVGQSGPQTYKTLKIVVGYHTGVLISP